jgi:hypothetical protein
MECVLLGSLEGLQGSVLVEYKDHNISAGQGPKECKKSQKNTACKEKGVYACKWVLLIIM